MSIVLNSDISKSLEFLNSRISNRSEEFENSLKKYGMDISNIASLKDNLASLTQSKEELSILSTIVDIILYCHFGLIKAQSDVYSEGHKILFSEIKSLVEGGIATLSNDIDKSDTEPSIQFSIYSIINEDCDFSNYTNDTCVKDLKFLVNLFTVVADKDAGYNKSVLDDIRNCTTSESDLKCVIGCMANMGYMMSCLKSLYANTFSLYPYVGVITFFGKRNYTRVRKSGEKEVRTRDEDVRVRADNKVKVFKPSLDMANSSLYAELAENIINASSYSSGENSFSEYNRSNNFIRQDRCFNLDDILDSESCGLYYPYEAFGFATGSLFSDYYEPAENDIVYQDSGFVSWSDYAEHIKPKLEDLFIKYIYKSLEKHCRINGKPFKFTDEKFIEDYNEFGSNRVYLDYCNPTSYQRLVLEDVDKFVKTICRGVVITRNDCNELFKVKLTSFSPSGLSKLSTKDIYNSTSFIQGSKTAEFSEAYVEYLKNIDCNIFEYTFCLDVQLMDKKPLFGYTAARLFQKSGQQISKTNMLIGETEDGTPLFSCPGGLVDMSSNICHRFSSGSRSGKGVMTMNILASSIASDVALFYIDRKPDMASELANISNGHMFCVNGGDLQSTDVHGRFYDFKSKKYSSMLSKFKPGSEEYKYKYMKAVFGENFGDEWKGAFGDLMYARAMILALSIVAARMYFIANPCDEAKADLYLDGSVAVVVDEITNWHFQFEHRYFATYAADANTKTSAVARFYNPLLGGSLSENSKLDGIASQLDEVNQELMLKYKSDIEKYREASNEGDDKATKALKSAVSNLNTLLSKLQKKAGKGVKDLEETLYWTTYMEKYRSAIDVVSAIKNAGIKDAMLYSNDVYYIGQFISGYANTSDAIVFNKDGTVRQQGMPEASIKKSADSTPNAVQIPTETVTRSYMLGFAETLGCDWFTGRNVTDKNNPESLRHANFGGTHMAETDPKLDSWLHTRGNWIYIPQGTQENFRGGNATNLPAKAVKFKPYLVLNTSDEPAKGVALNSEGVVDDSKVVVSPYNKTSLKYYDPTSCNYILNCANRVGFKDWERIRLQHVKPHLNASLNNPCYGNLEDGLGLKGLIVEYKRTNPQYSTYEFDPSCLSKSEDIANAIVRRFGYSDYIDYLLDLSPKGLIGCQDIIDIYTKPHLRENPEERYKSQLYRYFNSGNSSLIDGSSSSGSVLDSGLDGDGWDSVGQSVDNASHQTSEQHVQAQSIQENLMQPAQVNPNQVQPTVSPEFSTSNRNGDVVYGSFEDEEVDYEDPDVYEEEEQTWGTDEGYSAEEPTEEQPVQDDDWKVMGDSQIRVFAGMFLSAALANRPNANLSEAQKNRIIETLVAELRRRGF